MKKSTITIPVSKIASVFLFGTGIASSLIVDECVKKVSTGSKCIDQLGRNGLSILTSSAFIALAGEAWNDKSLDIKIPISKRDTKKDIKAIPVDLETANKEWKESKEFEKIKEKVQKRILKATDALDKITDFMVNFDEGYILKEKHIDEFNHQMMKLAKYVGFIPYPIQWYKDRDMMYTELDDNLKDAIDDLKEACKFIDMYDLLDILNMFTDDFEDKVDEHVIENIPESIESEAEDIDVNQTNINEFVNLLSNHDIHPNSIDMDKFNVIYDSLCEGTISAISACDMVLALVNANNQEDEEDSEEVVDDPVDEKVIPVNVVNKEIDAIDKELDHFDYDLQEEKAIIKEEIKSSKKK